MDNTELPEPNIVDSATAGHPMLRVRAWVIGVVLLVAGFATHASLELWPVPFAGRIEMGQLACMEFVLYAAGLGLAAVSLAGATGTRRKAGSGLWIAAALFAGLAVLWRLPP